jgi:hypothetical protein
MTERVVFAGSWRRFFTEFGLKSFDDFFDYPSSGRTSDKQKRHVSILNLGIGPNRKVFFLKRFYYPHFKDMLFAFRNFGRLCSQAECEWENANLLLDKGIGTYRPVCCGEQMKCGLERKSFFVTEQLQSQHFTDFVAQNWSQLTWSQKEKIIVALAKLIRKVHDEAIRLPDLYVWHIFIEEDEVPGEYDFAFIDLHRMGRSVKSPNKKIEDLGRLYWSMSDKYFDDKLKDLFVRAYMGDDWMGSKVALVRTIQRRVNVLAKRRKLKDY